MICVKSSMKAKRSARPARFGKTKFFEAVRKGRADEVAAAIDAHPELVSITDNAGRTPLHICAGRLVANAKHAAAAVATAKALVKAGADVNAIQSIVDDGEVFPATALWYALAWGRNRPLAAYLLRCNADPNHCMFALAFADDLPAAKLVRRHGAAIDEVFGGETPLIYAMRHRRAKFGEWLLREGADVSVADRKGLTALHHAVRRRLPVSTLRMLLARGANARAISNDGVAVGQLATRSQKSLLGIADASRGASTRAT